MPQLSPGIGSRSGEERAAARFAAAVRRLAPKSVIISACATEWEEHDEAKDDLCAEVGCCRGIYWKSDTRQLLPLTQQSHHVGVLLPIREFQRDLPRPGAKEGWIRHALKTLLIIPPVHGGKTIAADRWICVLQGWGVNEAEIHAQRKHANPAGAADISCHTRTSIRTGSREFTGWDSHGNTCAQVTVTAPLATATKVPPPPQGLEEVSGRSCST